MKCPRCNVDMVIGEAIKSENSRSLSIVPQPLITFETMEIIPCWKCPLCGHSDDGRESVMLKGIINHNR